jgi:hypothetical protein
MTQPEVGMVVGFDFSGDRHEFGVITALWWTDDESPARDQPHITIRSTTGSTLGAEFVPEMPAFGETRHKCWPAHKSSVWVFKT